MILNVNIEENLRKLLNQEDTDNDFKITIDDTGPKKFNLTTISGKIYEVSGTYYLSNLLQELVLAKEEGKETAIINKDYIFESPVERTNRLIKEKYWDGLTRKIDAEGISKIVLDSKAGSKKSYIYVPHSDLLALTYYKELAKTNPRLKLKVVQLPENITPEYVQSINNKPGILSLSLQKNKRGEIKGSPFVVPGGRFNEMYGWDSYFESLGLLEDKKIDLAKSMADNFIYQINHYGKILNANRTYYLTRSQPPFLTSMIRLIYKSLPKNKENKRWLKKSLSAAIKEYKTVWMQGNRTTPTRLSRYYGSGIGMPSETESTHFDSVLMPYAKKAGIDIKEFYRKYLNREIIEPKLEQYFIHDRSVRESGHDTSYRLENRCANLNTVDLNSLLYKYEIDIAEIIAEDFNNKFRTEEGNIENSDEWMSKAKKRKSLINKFMWNEEKGFFFDYDFKKEVQTEYESATSFYPLWAKIASVKQSKVIIKKALPVLETFGGVLSASKKSTGNITTKRPQRQWDYPYGWAPHQILIWEGLQNYGQKEVAQRLAYKWLYMILRNVVDYNGTIPEKYDVVLRSHKVFAEYGNVGTSFQYITKEGFGWMNASYQIGLSILPEELKSNLRNLIPPEWIF